MGCIGVEAASSKYIKDREAFRRDKAAKRDSLSGFDRSPFLTPLLISFTMSGLEGTASSAMTNDQIVFDAFNHHASAQRVETKQHVLNTLRKQYSEYHVTAVDAGQCSLLEFAAAGKATATFEGQEELFHATREWKPVGTGVEKKTHPGILQDDYSFAR